MYDACKIRPFSCIRYSLFIYLFVTGQVFQTNALENAQMLTRTSLLCSGVGSSSGVPSAALEAVRQLAALIIAVELLWPSASAQSTQTSIASAQSQRQSVEASTQTVAAIGGADAENQSISSAVSAAIAQQEEQLASLRQQLAHSKQEADELRANNLVLNDRLNRLQEVC